MTAALAVGAAGTTAVKRGLVRNRRRRALEDAVWGEGEPTRENPNPEPGLVREMSYTRQAVVAIAHHVGADISGIEA